MFDFIVDNISVILPILFTAIGGIFVFTNKKVVNWIRKNYIEKEEHISLNEKSLKYMEQYLKLQDEKFAKLIDENKKLIEELEESNKKIKQLILDVDEARAKCKDDMDKYKAYMKRVHKYVQGLQILLVNKKITFNKFDDNGDF